MNQQYYDWLKRLDNCVAYHVEEATPAPCYGAPRRLDGVVDKRAIAGWMSRNPAPLGVDTSTQDVIRWVLLGDRILSPLGVDPHRDALFATLRRLGVGSTLAAFEAAPSSEGWAAVQTATARALGIEVE